MRREAEAAAQARSDELQGDLFAATERKKSKYNGVLVDKFPEGLEVAAPVITSAKHPSIRYRVLCELVAPERRWMVASALSGELDSRLYSMYQEAGGSDVVNIRDTGENGRVSLKVDTGSGVSTEVDLGGNLETGYVVQSINDPLGIFPEGTEQGDFLEFGTVEVVLKSLGGGEGGNGGLMASGYVRSSASPGDHVELRYKSEDDSSNKFINMDYSGGPSFTATWGRFGSAGRQTEYPVAQWDSYYRGKRSKGYTDVTDGESVVPRVRRDVPVRPEPVARSVPNMEAPPPVPQKPKRQDPRQLELFASGRSKISSRFFTGG
jgi:predicted DNA-binding WGR domain protein